MKTKKIVAMVMTLLMLITMLPSLVFASAPQGELDGKLRLKGTAEVGSTLSANYKKVTPEGISDDYVSFQWSRKTGEELTEVGTESTYTVAEEDLGSVIVLEITGLEDMGITGSLTAESKTVAAAGEGVEESEADEEEEIKEETEEEIIEEEIIEEPSDIEEGSQPGEAEIGLGEEIPSESDDSEPLTYSAQAMAAEDGSEVVDFGSVEDGSAQAKYVVVRNTGTGALNFEPLSPDYFMVQDIEGTLEPGEEVTLWIQPREGLSSGTYENTITYTSEEGAEASFLASVTVEAADTPQITADTQALTFADLTEGYTEVSEGQKVQITNQGTQDVTFVLPQSTYFDVSAENGNLTAAAGGTAVFTVMPKLGLAAGEYSEELAFQSQDAQITVTASVRVQETAPEQEEPQESSVTADAAGLTFGTVEEGYETAPAAQTVTLTNNGTGTVALAQPSGENFQIGELSAKELAVQETATFTVQPKTGLSAGSYEDTIYIYDTEGNILTSLTAQLQVEAAEEPVYSLSAEPETLDFGSMEEGYAQAPSAQTVTITNDGTGTLNLIQPESEFFAIGALSDLVLEPGETAVFTVQPKKNLEESEYLEMLQINSTEDAYGIVNAYFNVTSAANALISVEKPSEITGLPYGTEKSVKGLKLPAAVVIVTQEGSQKASVTWDVSGCAYDPSSTQAQNFAVKGKVTLPADVENPNGVSLITSVRVSVQGRPAKIASADDNTITGISSNGQYTTDTKITFTAVGAGMDNSDPSEGDTRYIPLNWSVANTNSWQQAPYTATFRMSRAGTYTLSVAYNEQEYDGSKWVNTGATDTKSVTFTVANGSGTVTATPVPTGTAQSRNAVQTGDNTNIVPFVILLVAAVVCVAGIVIYRKRK